MPSKLPTSLVRLFCFADKPSFLFIILTETMFFQYFKMPRPCNPMLVIAVARNKLSTSAILYMCLYLNHLHRNLVNLILELCLSGRIPMRRLVYRVQPLPQSMLPLVWDFGQLSTEVETLYIRQMVHRYVRKCHIIFNYH